MIINERVSATSINKVKNRLISLFNKLDQVSNLNVSKLGNRLIAKYEYMNSKRTREFKIPIVPNPESRKIRVQAYHKWNPDYHFNNSGEVFNSSGEPIGVIRILTYKDAVEDEIFQDVIKCITSSSSTEIKTVEDLKEVI